MNITATCECSHGEVKTKLIVPCFLCNGEGRLEKEVRYEEDGGNYSYEGTGKFVECFDCGGSGNREL